MSKTSSKNQQGEAAVEPLHNGTLNLHDFAGKWALNRTIVQSSGDEFAFKGQADFIWQEARLMYLESGMVTAPNGAKLQAERTYFWQLGKTNQFDVYFEDNRYFHSFSGLVPHAEHLCGDDYYKVVYGFNHWPVWESLWQVTGPRKDYSMISRYQPA